MIGMIGEPSVVFVAVEPVVAEVRAGNSAEEAGELLVGFEAFLGVIF